MFFRKRKEKKYFYSLNELDKKYYIQDLIIDRNTSLLRELSINDNIKTIILNNNYPNLLGQCVSSHNLEATTILLNLGLNPNCKGFFQEHIIFDIINQEQPEILKEFCNYGIELSHLNKFNHGIGNYIVSKNTTNKEFNNNMVSIIGILQEKGYDFSKETNISGRDLEILDKYISNFEQKELTTIISKRNIAPQPKQVRKI